MIRDVPELFNPGLGLLLCVVLVLLKLNEKALKNVISSLKAEGHKVTRIDRQGAVFLLEVEKDGAAA